MSYINTSAYELDEAIAYGCGNITEFLKNVRPYFYEQKYGENLIIRPEYAVIINPLLTNKKNIN